ncbi:MAG TPA: SRPBCC domain-containing protein [Burkholderiaceae bacterium]|jgi:uncharacterized protein YndB with AHSA1/START domain
MPSVLARLACLCLVLISGAGHAAERSLDKEVIIKATLDQAWASWTTREGITSFFAPDAEIDPRVGGAFHIYIDPLADPGMKGADGMEFMALQPKKMLSFDWNAPPSLPEVRKQRTLVIIRFEAVDATHTRVTLHHTGWGDGGQWDQTYAYFDKAWTRVLGNLQNSYEKGPIDWTDWMASLRKMHAAPAAASR